VPSLGGPHADSVPLPFNNTAAFVYMWLLGRSETGAALCSLVKRFPAPSQVLMSLHSDAVGWPAFGDGSRSAEVLTTAVISSTGVAATWFSLRFALCVSRASPGTPRRRPHDVPGGHRGSHLFGQLGSHMPEPPARSRQPTVKGGLSLIFHEQI
jgi:hypothetical protein